MEGFGLENGGASSSSGNTPTPPQLTTGNPVQKSGGSSDSGSFDSRNGYAQSSANPGDMKIRNGQCECKSLEKSLL